MEIQENVLLAPFTTFHIGGPADYFVSVYTHEELLEAISYAKQHNLSYFILGTGANILIGDKGYRGLVIKNCMRSHAEPDFTQDGKVFLVAESGATIEDLIALTQSLGLSGFEDFAGIVSTVGGALWQNLHFLSADRSKTVYIADILQKANILHEDGRIEDVDSTYFQFGYDTSILHTKKDIVLSATFVLVPKDKDDIQKIIDANIAWREEKHPKDAQNCSAGSIFKKIEGYGAGRLIEQVGLKGKQIGGAQISNIHANFIVNTGNATAKDVSELIALVQETVKKELNLDLEVEISMVGEF